jgi:hypothetical protein
MSNDAAEVAIESQEDPDVAIARYLKAHGNEAMTWSDFHNIFDNALFPAFRNHKEKIAELKAEVERLKARPMLKWAGTFNPGQFYHEASLCTHRGGLWASQSDTTATPGESSAWRLIVKQAKVRRDEVHSAVAAVLAEKGQV